MKTSSVVIDNYNYGHFLSRAIDSVLSQTHPPKELIVVDDGSTDNSVDVIRSYGDKIIPVLKENGGHASAFNAGFLKATGDIIFFLDADDLMIPETIATVVSSWKPGVVMIHYPMERIDTEGRIIGVFPSEYHELKDGDYRSQLLETGSFPTTLTSGLAFDKKTLDNVMPIDEKIFTQAADGYLVRAAAIQGPVQAINKCLAKQTRHDANDSNFAIDYNGIIKSLRRQIRYIGNELASIPVLAEKFGHVAQTNLENRNVTYLTFRLFSLKLDPKGHPIKDDTILKLLRDFSIANIKDKRKTKNKKMLNFLISFSTAASPHVLAKRIIRFQTVPESRPQWTQIASKHIKRLMNFQKK